ncbi:MAG: winged helix-turn-helix domain-containing protein [Pyrinomonadaceae bacterium]
MKEEHDKVYAFGPFRLDGPVRRLLRTGRPVPLKSKLYDILLLLVERHGQLVTKEELMQAVWPDRFVEENNLTVHMSALRRVLGESHRAHRYIETVPGRGYRFVAKISAARADDAAWGGGAQTGTGLAADADANRAVKYLAVLPFLNVHTEPELEYLADGVTESIINSLAQLRSLRVLARSTVFRYKNGAADPLTTGRALGVQVVLTGRISQLGSALTVSVELVDVEDGTQVWGAHYHRQLTDLLAVQADIAREVSRELSPRLTSEEGQRLTSGPTASAAAYELYLKGRYLWNKRTEEGLRKAITYFQRAAAADERYALAYAGLADCYNLLKSYGVLPPRASIPQIKAAAEQALALDDRLAEAHASLGLVSLLYDWDSARAEQSFSRAIGFSPSYSTAHHWYSLCLRGARRFDEARAELRLAQALDPLSLIINTAVGVQLFYERRYVEAIDHLRETLELEPRFYSAHSVLGQAYVQRGMFKEAVAAAKRGVKLSHHPEALALLGYVQAMAGEGEEARLVLATLNRLAQSRYIDPAYLANVYLGLGERAQACAWLTKAYENRSEAMTLLHLDPRYDSLRADPRFKRLLRRVGLDT